MTYLCVPAARVICDFGLKCHLFEVGVTTPTMRVFFDMQARVMVRNAATGLYFHHKERSFLFQIHKEAFDQPGSLVVQ